MAFAEDHGLPQRPARDFIADFRGLSATAKTKAICDSLGLSRRSLADVVLDPALVAGLLAAMKEGSRAPKPKDLGMIGRDHLLQRFVAAGAQADTFDYQVSALEHDGLPYVIEIAFAYAPGLAEQRKRRGGRALAYQILKRTAESDERAEEARPRPPHGHWT